MTYHSSSSWHSSRSLSATTLALSLVLALPLGAQEAPQEVLVETKLVAGDGAEGDNFGSAIAIDGDVMVVAAPSADVGEVETSGAVYVFLRDTTSGAWIEHQHLLPANGDFGDSFLALTLAIDGDTIVVGAPYQTIRDFQEGAVYVFERDQGGPGLWGEVARLADVRVDHGGHFGSGVALEGDLLVVGAAQDSSARNGLVQLFERDRGGLGNWGRVTTLAHTSVNDGANPKSFGSDVAIQGDLLVVGASRTSLGFNTIDGAAYIFRRSATDPDRWDYLVRLVRPGADSCTGGRPLSQFNLEATPEEIEAAAACAQANPVKSGAFGHRVAIEGDTLVVTARFAAGDDGTFSVGEAYVYRRDPGGADVWPYVATLSPSVPSSSGYFGSALALAGDTVLIGAPGTTIEARNRQGAAYAFERAAGGPDAWGEVARLLAYDGLSEAQFGVAVALDGAARIIGAQGDSTYRGAIYIQARSAEEPPSPAFEATGELVDGGIVEHPAGVLLGAPEGSLSGPLPVWIHEVPAPVEPLPSRAILRSGYYNVGAVETSIATGDGAFALALPVPAGADTAHLAAAILVPTELLLDEPATDHLWIPMVGIYDPESGLFSIVLDGLYMSGSTVALMEHPDIASRSRPTAPVPTRRPENGSLDDDLSGVTFDVFCYNFASSDDCRYEDLESSKLTCKRHSKNTPR